MPTYECKDASFETLFWLNDKTEIFFNLEEIRKYGFSSMSSKKKE